MTKNKRVALQRFWRRIGSVIAYGASLPLKVMVIARHPAGLVSGVFNVFIAVKFPNFLAVPVKLHDICLVLHGIFAGAAPAACDKITAGENLIGKSVHAFPDIMLAPVHIHKDSADFLTLKNSQTVPAFFRIVNRDTGRINSRMTHNIPPILYDLFFYYFIIHCHHGTATASKKGTVKIILAASTLTMLPK